MEFLGIGMGLFAVLIGVGAMVLTLRRSPQDDFEGQLLRRRLLTISERGDRLLATAEQLLGAMARTPSKPAGAPVAEMIAGLGNMLAAGRRPTGKADDDADGEGSSD